MITDADLTNWFTYHAPDDLQKVSYENIRKAALDFATVVLANTPAGADQSAAMRKIRESVMTANASVATYTKEPK